MSPKLILMCGLPGSGKTTRAKKLEHEQKLVRLSPDEWILNLYDHRLDHEHHEQAREQVEKLQWELAKRLLILRQSVVLENGFWSRNDRQKHRKEAQALGAEVYIDYEDVPIEELWRRASIRPETQDVGMLHFTKKDLEEWVNIFEPPTTDELAN